MRAAFEAGPASWSTAPSRVGRRARRGRRSHPGGHVRLRTRETEQANVVIGVPGVARDDDRRFALGVLNAAFGGGMSSRLFQEVREKRGLAYCVYSFTSSYTDAGLVGVYAGCQPAKLPTRCSTSSAASSPGSRPRASPTDELRRGEGPAARRDWSSGSRTPGRG